MAEYYLIGDSQDSDFPEERNVMEGSNPGLVKNQPVCVQCNKPLRFLGEKKIIDGMEKGLIASVTLADKSLLRLYVCDTCRRVEFYLP